MHWDELTPAGRLKVLRHQLWTLPKNPRLFVPLATVLLAVFAIDNRVGGLWGTAVLLASIPVVVLLLRRDAERRGLVDT